MKIMKERANARRELVDGGTGKICMTLNLVREA